MPDRVFVDTAGWATLFIATEPYHQQAAAWFSQAREQEVELVTTNYVLIELVALFTSPMRVPWGRVGTPEDIAKAVAFLASHDADYVTGATLLVDGGMALTGALL